MDKLDWTKVPDGTQAIVGKNSPTKWLEGKEYTFYDNNWGCEEDSWPLSKYFLRNSKNVLINPIYPQDTEDFDYDGNAVKYLNGRKLTWDVDKQQWYL